MTDRSAQTNPYSSPTSQGRLNTHKQDRGAPRSLTWIALLTIATLCAFATLWCVIAWLLHDFELVGIGAG